MKDFNEVAQSWLNGDFDPETKCKIIELRNNDPAGFEDAFYKNLEFGTGGLRGIMGVGTNRMNKYTVGMATQGLANYILKHVQGDDIKVCISYDSRNNSREFARIAADVLSANGIHVYIFDNIRPTPEMSYAVRKKGAVAGIMITASHNPKEYNGYKVSWSDGGQVTSPVDKEIVDEVAKITDPSQVKFKSDLRCGAIDAMGKEMDEAYLSDLLSLSLSPEAAARHSDIKIVYTPLHGCGVRLVPEILSRAGFKNVMEGKIASFPKAMWYMSRFLNYMPEMEGKYDITTIPVFEEGQKCSVGIGGTGTVVTEQSADPALAAEFLAWAKLSEDGEAHIWNDLGFDVCNSALWFDDDFAFDESNPYNTFFRVKPYEVLQQLANEDAIGTIYTTTVSPTLNDYMCTTTLNEVFEDGMDIDEALAEAQEYIEMETM